MGHLYRTSPGPRSREVAESGRTFFRRMTAHPTTPNEVERLSGLIEAMLADAEARVKSGERVSVSELNGLRRLIAWRDDERRFQAALAASRGRKAAER